MRSNNNVVYICRYHVVFCPKYRRQVLTPPIDERLKVILTVLKGYSSHALRAEFPALKRRLPSLWTNNYFVSTVGGVTLETLKRYVENQKGK